MISSQSQIQKAKKLNIQIDDDQSYLKCHKLLQQQFQQQQQTFNKQRKKLKINIQKYQQHIQLYKQQKIIKNKQIKMMQEEIKQLQIDVAKANKKKIKRQSLQENITGIHFSIQDNNKKLQQCKQKSYQQKSIFLELQTIQSNLIASIQNIESHEKAYLETKKMQQKYKQLKKLKQKIQNKHKNIDNDIQIYLKEKIDVMSGLRTSLINIDQQLDTYVNRIEQQQYIIEGLKERVSKEERQDDQDDQIYKKYRSKYQDLYFNDKNHLDNWKNYKNYLQQLLKRNQVPYQPFQHQSAQPKPQQKRLNKPTKTQPSIFYIQNKEQSSRMKTPSRNQSYKQSNSLYISNQGVKLPKLIKLSGKNQSKMKQTLKSNIKKMLNQSDISLQSIDSKGSNASGEYIEVEYHKK